MDTGSLGRDEPPTASARISLGNARTSFIMFRVLFVVIACSVLSAAMACNAHARAEDTRKVWGKLIVRRDHKDGVELPHSHNEFTP